MLWKMEGFCCKKGGARELLVKEKKGLFGGRPSSLWGKKKVFIIGCLSFLWAMERAHVTITDA